MRLILGPVVTVADGVAVLAFGDEGPDPHCAVGAWNFAEPLDDLTAVPTQTRAV